MSVMRYTCRVEQVSIALTALTSRSSTAESPSPICDTDSTLLGFIEIPPTDKVTLFGGTSPPSGAPLQPMAEASSTAEFGFSAMRMRTARAPMAYITSRGLRPGRYATVGSRREFAHAVVYGTDNSPR